MNRVKRWRLVVSGVVHGVGFRKFVDRSASELGLSGWVRNLNDGTVEIDAQGGEPELFSLFSQAMHGPQRSRVSAVMVEPSDPDPDLRGFAIIF